MPPANGPAAAGEIAAVLFDYGGTLDGDALHWFDHFVALYREAGSDVPLAELKTAFYAADRALPRDPAITTFGLAAMVHAHVRLQLVELGLDAPDLAARLAARFIADTRSAWHRNRPMLRRLAAHYRLGVVSNSYGNMPALLTDADLAPFEVVLDSALVGVAKPDPAIYRLAATRLALPPAAILHVGDSWQRDVVPAHAVGMRTAWIARPDAPLPSVPTPVWRLGSLVQLEALLR